MTKEEYVCPNQQCSRYNNYIAKYGHFKLVWVSGKGLMPDKDKCPECGTEITKRFVEVEGSIDIKFGRFASSNAEDKKRMILNRNKEVAKKDREMKEHYKEKQLKKMES